MKIFKFGGASVKDADGVRNLKRIIAQFSNEELLVVISAMDKTTNKLELVVNAFTTNAEWKPLLEEVFDFHQNVLKDLMKNQPNETLETLDKIKTYAFTFLEQDNGTDYDFIYDQIVSLGEILSTKIIAAYLESEGINATWKDARKLIHTDNNYRDARIDWEISAHQIGAMWSENNFSVVVTQGFIGGGNHNRMTTLGREGSDFSAAIFAYCLNAESVTIWKDVPGMLNADPKHFSNTSLLPNISYKEAIELSYYGASVIHPKTVKPLENKNIPLHIKSFVDPNLEGSVINHNTSEDSKIPSYIFKTNQVLLSISTRDFSFIVEEHMSDIFSRFAKQKLKIQTMQNSAISFSVSIEHHTAKIQELINDLQQDYQVRYNEGLELMTIRHYNESIIQELIKDKEVLLEQKTRHTMRLLMRNKHQ